jgi:hypothetical protein
MPRLGFEPTIPVFERAETVHALDRAATVTGIQMSTLLYFSRHCSFLDVTDKTSYPHKT